MPKILYTVLVHEDSKLQCILRHILPSEFWEKIPQHLPIVCYQLVLTRFWVLQKSVRGAAKF
jgi:hypothetical protein